MLVAKTIFTVMFTALFLLSSFTAAVAQPAAVNLALHKKYTFSTRPNYPLCQDADDSRQLTDGKYVKGYFWTQKGTVGWTRPKHLAITLDLGKIYPISGISWNCAAGKAGVEWPQLLIVMVSDDNRKYYPVGDLVQLTPAPKPAINQYKIFTYRTDKLKTYGRYVKIMPVSSGAFIFVDEIAVYAGAENYLKLSRGRSVSPVDYVSQKLFVSYVKKRFQLDLQAVKKLVKASKLPASTRQRLEKQLKKLTAQLTQAAQISPDKFRAVLPYNSWHRQLIALRAALWRAQGMDNLLINNAERWDMLHFWDEPPRHRSLKPVTITVMRNEKRAAVINISNPLPRAAKIDLQTAGNIPAELLSFKQVEWVDTRKGIPVAAALTELHSREPLTIASGMTRQLWIQADSANVNAGSYRGTLLLKAGSHSLQLPLHITVAPVTFPARPQLHLGGWDYTDAPRARGITAGNKLKVIKYLQQHHVDVTWASGPTLAFGKFNRNGEMTVQPDSRRFDAWVKLWPQARYYAVFRNVQPHIGALKIGSKPFKTAVGNWVKWWQNHCRKHGIKPEQIALLLVDEPHNRQQDETITAWARAIKAAGGKFTIWEDPTNRKAEEQSSVMLDNCDIICPNRPLYLKNKKYRELYRRRAQRQTVWFYSCSGPNRLLDPYSYFLLQAWECLKINAKGTNFWAFCDTGGGSSSWNPYLQTGTSYVPFYLSPNSVTDAKYMAAINESIQDYQYFMMLKQAVAKAESTGGDKQLIAGAKKFIIQAVDAVLEAENASTLEWSAPKDRTIADKMRRQALQWLMKFKAK